MSDLTEEGKKELAIMCGHERCTKALQNLEYPCEECDTYFCSLECQAHHFEQYAEKMKIQKFLEEQEKEQQ